MPTSRRHHRALRAYEQAPLQPMRRPSLVDRVGAAVGRRCCAALDHGLRAVRRMSWGDVLAPSVWAALIVYSAWFALRGAA